GGYIVVGTVTSNDGDVGENYGGYDGWVIKLDASGNLIHKKVLGGNGRDTLTSVVQTTDGGYVAAGYTQSTNPGVYAENHGGNDGWVVRLDSSLNVLGEKLFGGTGADGFNSVVQTSDGGYVLAGYSPEESRSPRSGWLVRLDSFGTLMGEAKLRSADIAEQSSNYFNCVKKTSDGYIAVGNPSLWTVKLDTLGNLRWEKTSSPSNYPAVSVWQTNDGGYIIAGGRRIYKLDFSGAEQWNRWTVGITGSSISSAIGTNDGGYIAADVWSEYYGSYSTLYRYDSEGTVLWRTTDSSQVISCIEKTSDSGFIAAGYRTVTDKATEFYVAKFAPEAPVNWNPIVFIPGVMKSHLFTSPTDFSSNTCVWPPSRFNDGEKLKIENTLYVRDNGEYYYANEQTRDVWDAKKEVSAPYEREYGAQGDYKEIIDGLCAAFPNRPVYFFSYDWRQNNVASAEKLRRLIEELTKNNTERKVDLVCHSMGGLVASSYYDMYTDHRTDRIITAGTPYEGSPYIFGAVLKGDVTGKWWEDIELDLLVRLTKDIKKQFWSVPQLVPTKQYTERIPMIDTKDKNIDYSAYSAICDAIFGPVNANLGRIFQEGLRADGYNVLLKYPKSYFVVGKGRPTIGAAIFDQAGEFDDNVDAEDLVYENIGDGTVPYQSGSILEQIERLAEASSPRGFIFETDHSGLVGHSRSNAPANVKLNAGRSLDTIISILRGSPDKILYTRIPMGYTTIRAGCPVDATVTKDGETLTSNETLYNDLASFGRMDLIGKDADIKMFCLDEGVFPVSLQGTGTGTMDYSIRFFDGDGKLLEERNVGGVPITPSTRVTTDTDRSKPTVLQVDKDGDGVIDETLTTEPGKPEDPTNPSDPEKPDDPENPSDPENPDNPDNPNNPTYGLSLSVTGMYVFPPARTGYGDQTPLEVIVTNTGNQPTGTLWIELPLPGQANWNTFVLSKTTLGSIAAGGRDSFTIAPRMGLASRYPYRDPYANTVTVRGDNGLSKSFNVSFTVYPVDGGDGGGGGGDWNGNNSGSGGCDAGSATAFGLAAALLAMTAARKKFR
ncbi:MAG: alpha/beta hydrolase, partial [Synergistaceae bacterium]|nr:alpha/beta hydrolase [Synergistaceae bacterium]